MIKVFLSYSHKDEELQKELNEHLGALKHANIVDTWWDSRIVAGNDWSEDIARQLEAADLILLLVSSAFLASTYCYQKELRRAIERHDAGEARVVPILLRPCHWEPAPFAKLQGLPTGMVPVTAVAEDKRDAIWAEVAKGIHQAAISCSGGKSTTIGETKPDLMVAITGVLSVDEEGLDTIFQYFNKGDRVGIKWPKSSDQLIGLVQEVIKRFDEEHIDFVGSDEFITTGPTAIRKTFSSRAKCEKRLPELVGAMSDFGRDRSRVHRSDFYRNCGMDAIKFYLLRANFLAHWRLGYLSSWEGLSRLNFRAPDAWIPYQGIPSDKFYPRLYNETETTVRIRLREIGDYKITRPNGGPDWIYIDVPRSAVDERGNFLSDETAICRWAIPEVELSEQLGISPPSSYNGRWVGALR
jgi:hypothetical protein